MGTGGATQDQVASYRRVVGVRRAVLDRDNWQCQVCGVTGENRLHLHHVVYRSQGGKDDESNLVTVCHRCHRSIHEGKVRVVLVLVDGVYRAFQQFTKGSK